MRIMRVLLIGLVAAFVIMGCSKKMAAPEATPEQAQEMAKPGQTAAVSQVEEVTLSLSGVT